MTKAQSPQDILAERICKRLADLAKEMTKRGANKYVRSTYEELIQSATNPEHKLSLLSAFNELQRAMKKAPSPWEDLKYDLISLTPEDFQVIYNLGSKHKDMLDQIEDAVNAETNPQVTAYQGKFSFGADFTKMFYPDLTTLITFNPDVCKGTKKQYAALMVVQYLETQIKSMPTYTGRLLPAGMIIGGYYGVISTHSFHGFAYALNGVLDKYALPEEKPSFRINFNPS